MKELFKDEFENGKVDKEIVASIQKKKEHKLIGSWKVVKGHLLFKYNPFTNEISQNIKYKKTDLVMNDFFNFDIESIQTKVEVEKDWIYVQALNTENAIKRLNKMGYNTTGIKLVK